MNIYSKWKNLQKSVDLPNWTFYQYQFQIISLYKKLLELPVQFS